MRKQLRYQLVYRHELTRSNEVLKVPWPLTHDMSSGVLRLRALVNRGTQGPRKTPLHQLSILPPIISEPHYLYARLDRASNQAQRSRGQR